MAVADVGAGSGFYSLLFADAVGENGKVYVVDIADYFVEGTLARGEELGLKNLVGVVNNARSVMLPDHSVDRIFVSATYHHFEYPQSTLASMVAALKPGGELIIVDYRKRPLVASMWVQSHVRLDRQEVIDEVEQAGFRYLDEPLELKQFYMLRFARD
jgi:ubiquinone/menaquinone biosynthesis C-methylase UbiE